MDLKGPTYKGREGDGGSGKEGTEGERRGRKREEGGEGKEMYGPFSNSWIRHCYHYTNDLSCLIVLAESLFTLKPSITVTRHGQKTNGRSLTSHTAWREIWTVVSYKECSCFWLSWHAKNKGTLYNSDIFYRWRPELMVSVQLADIFYYVGEGWQLVGSTVNRDTILMDTIDNNR